MQIVNLTPHPINLHANGVVTEYPSQGIARAAQTDTPAESLDGIPTVTTTFGALAGVPAYSPGTYYVVSSLAAQAAVASGRTTADLLVPSGIVRDDRGRVIGCTQFARV